MKLLLIALLAALAACPLAPDDVARTATVRGAVVELDLSPMAYDGDARIEVRTARGPAVVLVPARMGLCQAEGLQLVGELAVGDEIEARGIEQNGAVTPCLAADHYLRRAAD